MPVMRRLDTTPEGSEALARAKARLDALDWYPRPVRLQGVQMYLAPWFFRLPFMRRFHGYTAWNLILLRSEPFSDGLVSHELCHVWQMQHRPLRMPLTYLYTPYRSNPYEIEARRAAAEPPR